MAPSAGRYDFATCSSGSFGKRWSLQATIPSTEPHRSIAVVPIVLMELFRLEVDIDFVGRGFIPILQQIKLRQYLVLEGTHKFSWKSA